MNDEQKELQWHPAFFAGIQIEFEAEADQLEFQNEVQLGTKPKEMDVLIINKDTGRPIKKNIGRIFRKRNIIEYKSPTDYLSIDDFYKGYGYACFYKATATEVNAVKAEDLTLTFVCAFYPRKLMNHLEMIWKCIITPFQEGIFHVSNHAFPMQIIVTTQLSENTNFWLKSLTNKQLDGSQVEYLLNQYGPHKKEKLYQSVMDIIVRANKEIFKEDGHMCDALLEIMKDELDERALKGEIKGKIATAKNMLNRGLDLTLIAECTGLSMEEVEKLK